MTYARLLLLSFVLLCTHGCAIQPAKSTDNTQSPRIVFLQQDNLKELLNFNHEFANFDQPTQKKTFYEINQASIKNNQNALLKIKLASMLVLPSSKVKDYVTGLDLLQGLQKNSTLSEAEIAYVETLYAFSIESSKLQQQIKDEQKKSELLAQKSDALQKKYDALEKKLTDLKNIEKKLIDRDIKPNEK